MRSKDIQDDADDYLDFILNPDKYLQSSSSEEEQDISLKPNRRSHHRRSHQRKKAVDFTEQLALNPDLFLLKEEDMHLVFDLNWQKPMSIAQAEALLLEPRPPEYFNYLHRLAQKESGVDCNTIESGDSLALTPEQRFSKFTK